MRLHELCYNSTICADPHACKHELVPVLPLELTSCCSVMTAITAALNTAQAASASASYLILYAHARYTQHALSVTVSNYTMYDTPFCMQTQHT
jgi:hypothetical protein